MKAVRWRHPQDMGRGIPLHMHKEPSLGPTVFERKEMSNEGLQDVMKAFSWMLRSSTMNVK